MNCRTCGAGLPGPFLDLGLQPSGPELVHPDAGPEADTLEPLRLTACRGCGLMQLAERQIVSERTGHGHATTASVTLAEGERAWARELADTLPPTQDVRVLDVAAGDGTLLGAIRQIHGDAALLRGYGAEAEDRGARDADGMDLRRNLFGPATARSLRSDATSFDLVIVNQALAHGDEPRQLLKELTSVLAPAGVLALEAHHGLGLLRDGQVDTISHAHSIYPLATDLLRAFDMCGLAISTMTRVDSFGGSLRVIARLKGQPDPGGGRGVDADAMIGGILADEMAAHPGSDRALHTLADAARRGARDLHDYLVARRAAGARVVGYGAPSRAGVLLNLADVDVNLLPYTVDRNPAKQGLSLAGSRVPVRAPTELEQDPPDDILILPWTLAGEIAQQLAPIRAAGTRLVVAMPKLRILD